MNDGGVSWQSWTIRFVAHVFVVIALLQIFDVSEMYQVEVDDVIAETLNYESVVVSSEPVNNERTREPVDLAAIVVSPEEAVADDTYTPGVLRSGVTLNSEVSLALGELACEIVYPEYPILTRLSLDEQAGFQGLITPNVFYQGDGIVRTSTSLEFCGGFKLEYLSFTSGTSYVMLKVYSPDQRAEIMVQLEYVVAHEAFAVAGFHVKTSLFTFSSRSEGLCALELYPVIHMIAEQSMPAIKDFLQLMNNSLPAKSLDDGAIEVPFDEYDGNTRYL